jgi:hypothetical protein
MAQARRSVSIHLEMLMGTRATSGDLVQIMSTIVCQRFVKKTSAIIKPFRMPAAEDVQNFFT